ncbi:MAG: 30S ribosomal protein S3 [Candidatus Kerfeldbacteria bacterium]|nr:30S ribosomal protein S3 [Candidatus Kerfeldbacteria bacterium]
MGKKINPRVFRLGITRSSTSRWITRDHQHFAKNLREDVQIRSYLKKKLRGAGLASIDIERFQGSIAIILHTSRPGMVIGRAGAGAEELKKELMKRFFGNQKIQLNLSVQEVKNPDTNAEIVLQGMIEQIEKRLPFRRVMKRTIEAVMRAGALGVKVMMSGRLNGAEIARREKLFEGKIPLHTLRADIDYSRGVARTTFGAIGVKVWVYKGDVFEESKNTAEESTAPIAGPRAAKSEKSIDQVKTVPV